MCYITHLLSFFFSSGESKGYVRSLQLERIALLVRAA